MTITNGTFDTDLLGWTTSGDGQDYDVIWENSGPTPGRSRLRVYKCSNAYLTQTFTIDNNTITFDYETLIDNWYEPIGWKLVVDTTTLYDEGLPVSRAGHYTGTIIRDVTPYIGQIATLEFRIVKSSYCYYGDHANTFLWIDNVQLVEQPIVGYLEIHSDPTGADVYIDDQLAATTTETLTLPIGVYNLRVHKDGYIDRTETIIITSGFTLYRSYYLPVLVTGTGPINISSTPPGAKIYIDNIDTQQITPTMITEVPVGNHNIKLTLTGYQYWEGIVSVVEGVIITVDTTLVQLIITAIDITATPSIVPCIEGTCIVDISVTWQNTGDAPIDFVPNISIDDVPISPAPYPSESVGGRLTTTRTFTVSGLTKTGSPHSICPVPN